MAPRDLQPDADRRRRSATAPLTVVIPTRNEIRNLPRCLAALEGWADEIIVVDSHSTDGTRDVATRFGAVVLDFEYTGGWPKKRQWVLDEHALRNDWVLLLDADEILLPPVKHEIATAIRAGTADGYWIRFEIVFLNRQLRFGDTVLWKLALFRYGRGQYERRLDDQDPSMSDVEVHEHVVVTGTVGRLRAPVRHENWNSLDQYILKHNEYSNWEAHVHVRGRADQLRPSLWGNQAQRRRWLKRAFLRWPGSPTMVFLYRYIFRLGFLDGQPGLLFAAFKAVQLFQVKAKMYELTRAKTPAVEARHDAREPDAVP